MEPPILYRDIEVSESGQLRWKTVSCYYYYYYYGVPGLLIRIDPPPIMKRVPSGPTLQFLILGPATEKNLASLPLHRRAPPLAIIRGAPTIRETNRKEELFTG